jgi:hypothetical protein
MGTVTDWLAAWAAPRGTRSVASISTTAAKAKRTDFRAANIPRFLLGTDIVRRVYGLA